MSQLQIKTLSNKQSYSYEANSSSIKNINHRKEDIIAIKINIQYTVNIRCELIEHHSFLRWIDTFREKGMGLEATCNTIYEKIMEIVSPNNLKVTALSHSNYSGYNKAVRENNWQTKK